MNATGNASGWLDFAASHAGHACLAAGWALAFAGVAAAQVGGGVALPVALLVLATALVGAGVGWIAHGGEGDGRC